MRKLVIISCVLGLFLPNFYSCKNPETKKQEQMPSDSLKSAVAASVEAYVSTLVNNEDTSMIFSFLKAYLDQNQAVYGSAFALAPVITDKDTMRSAPYVYRTENAYVTKYLEKSYDYSQDSWFTQPLALKKGYWTEPYFDEGGGNVKMITYSIPVYKSDTLLLGVFTADLELKQPE